MNRKIKVVIADDIKPIVDANKILIEKNENIEVVGVGYNGKEELDMILEFKPDLVITDNQMPIMNGTEVIKEINNLKLDNKPDFIVVTGDYSWEFNKQCNELNVFGIINKLYSGNDLFNAVKEYVSYKNEIANNNKNNNTSNPTSEKSLNKKNIFEKLVGKIKERCRI